MISIEVILIAFIVMLVVVIAIMYLRLRCVRRGIERDKSVFQNSVMSVVFDGSLTIVDIVHPNEALLFYISPAKFKGSNIRELFEMIDPAFVQQMDIVRQSVLAARNQKKTQYFEYNVTKKDGVLTYAICIAEYVSDTYICCHVMSVDSKSFHTERQSFVHSVFDSLSDNTEIGMYIRSVNDNDKNYVLFNKITRELYGDDDVANSKWWNQSQEDAEDLLCVERNVPLVFEREVLDSKCVRRYLRVTKRMVQTQDGYRYVNATMTDLTELKQKSDTLQNTIINLETSLNASHSTVWKYDLKSECFSSINSKDSLTFDDFYVRVHPKYSEKCVKAFENLVSGVSEYESVEYCYIKKDGSFDGRFVSEMVVVKDAKGRLSHIVGNRRDVTNEYVLQKELKDNLRMLNVIYDNTPIGIAYSDKDGYIIKMNATFHNVLGVENRYNRAENKISILNDELIPLELRQSLKNGVGVSQVISFDTDMFLSVFTNSNTDINTLKENKKLHFDMKIIVLKSQDGAIEGFIVICMDITDATESNQRIAELYKQQETILEMLPVGVELYNIDGWLVYQNRMAQSLFGCNDLSNKVNILDNPNMPTDIQERSERGEDISFEMKFDFDKILESNVYDTKHKGVSKYLKITAKAIKDEHNSILRYAAIILDTTESVEARKRIEENILKLNMIIENSAITPWDYDCNNKAFIPYNFKHRTKNVVNLRSYMDVGRPHPDNQSQIDRQMNRMTHGVDERFSLDIKYKWIYETDDAPWSSGTLAGEPFERDEDGKVIRYIGFLKDTTQLSELNDKLALLNVQNQLVLNNTQSGFIYFTPDYKVQWENVSIAYSHLCLAHQYKKGLVCYRDVKGLSSPCSKCVLPLAIKNKTVYSQEIYLGDNLYVELIVTPAFRADGELEGVVMRVDDVTERRRINLELKQAKERAEQSNQLKSAFLANMSHEIRTPLNSIIGFSNIVMETEDVDEREEYRKIITTNSEMLLNLINDILDLSKVESGYLEIMPGVIDMVELFDELKVSFSRRMKEGVELECESPYEKCITFGMDKQRLLQVITNFMSNAIKFTRRGTVCVGYECTDAEDGVMIYVRDTGIGISEENQHKTFQRFQKFDSFAQGTGLGLSICRAMTEAMHGEVGMESEYGVGSTFWAKIPCQIKSLERREQIVEDAERLMSESGKAGVVKRLRILIAENEDNSYAMMKNILKQHRLTRALNGNEVVAYFENDEYDVVLMNVKMPHMDGCQATIEIRKFNRKVPIIALLNSSFDSDRESAMVAGCSDSLVKPVFCDDLLKVINRLV